MSKMWKNFREDPKNRRRWRLTDMPLLWRKEAWKDPFQFLLFERDGIIIFLWSSRWFDEIFLKLIEDRWFTGLHL
jgi:hypothetical protein